MDVLCGRGRGYFDHPGNRRMLSIIAAFKVQYQTASKVEKSSITQNVLDIILAPQGSECGARFLKKSGTSKGSPWFELSEKEVHKKVAHTLREQKDIVKSKVAKRSAKLSEPEEGASIDADIQPEPLVATVSLSSVSCTEGTRPKQTERMEKDYHDALATFRGLPSMQIVVPVSDDEGSLKHDQCRKLDLLMVPAEPLSFQQEPIFNEIEIHNLLHNVLDEDDAEDVILDSFLDGIDLHSSLRSLR